ncbi:MAG: DNRLRE domain-containing protein [Candidatus Nanopelagicales bacterium]
MTGRHGSVLRPARPAAALVVAALLLGTVAPAASATPAAAPAPQVDQAPLVLERPDAVTAQIAAKAQGSKVEVTGERTESRRVWANPDGSFTAEVYSGPNWVQGADGTWDEIDTTLIRDASGDVVPKAAAVDVTLAGDPSAAPSGTAINVVAEVAVPRSSLDDFADAQTDPTATVPVTDDAGAKPASVSVGTDGALPAPVVSGNEATYAGAADGRDLRVRVLPSGVQTFVDIDERPAQIPAEGVVVSLPLAAKGVTVAESPDGGIVLKDAKTGEVVSRAPAARVWDANIDPVSGESSHGFVADTLLRKTSTGYDLSVVIPADYFDTPDLRYPITVDPSYTFTTVSKDTYVEKGYDNTAFGSEPDLKVGTYDAGTHVARSYLMFTLGTATSFVDTANDRTVVDSAKLKLWLYHSASCTSATMNIRYLTESFSETTSTWNNKPTQSAAVHSPSDAKRNDSSGSCAQGWLDTTSGTEVKDIVQEWVGKDATDPANYGFALTASETASSGWKRFYSSEYSTSSRRPSMTVTYHHKPTTPAAVTLAGRNSAGWVRSATPSLSATVADLDGGTVAGAFYVSTSSTFTSTTWSGSTSVASGTTATKTSGTLAQGTQYYARARASQAYSTSTEYSGYTAGVAFKVDSIAPTLTISCTGTTENEFIPNPPTANVPCTATATDATSGVASFSNVTLDGQPTGVLNLSGTGASRTFNLQQSAVGTGWHVVSATVTDNAGNTTTKTYSFGIGTSQMTLPADEQTTSSGTVVLEVSAGGGVSTHVQYSTDGSTWTTIPAAQLTTLAGAGVTTPLPLTGTGLLKSAQVRWDMTFAFGDDAVVSIRPCVVPTVGQPCLPPTTGQPRTVTLDRSGAGAASTTVGPISVALTTGAASLDTMDAAVGGASIGRSYSSFSPNTDGAFGKGWTTALGSPAGTNWSHLADTGSGLLLYASTGGDPISFAPITAASGCDASYGPVDDATGLDICEVVAAGATMFTLHEIDGPETSFTIQSGSTYILASVYDPDTEQLTEFNSDGTGTTRIIPPLPPGIVCPSSDTASWQPGCSDLLVTYDSSRVSTITWRGYEQPLDGSTPVLHSYDVACYRYDNGRLTQVWDPRDNTGGYAACGAATSAPPSGALATGYGYDPGSGRLTSVTPPGLQPWTITYNGTSGKATAISRTHTPGFNGGATETTTIQYDAPIGAATSGDDTHPDLTAAAVAAWWPVDPAVVPVTAPVYATAVYPPGASTSDLRNAAVTAMDEYGRAIMTAGFSGTGQAGWKVATQVLDPLTGAVRATLTPGNRDAALNPASPLRTDVGLTGTTAEAARMLATTTVYANLVNDNGDGATDSDDIADVTDTYGPLHLGDVAGAQVAVRAHTHTTYGDVATGTVPSDAADRASAAPVHAALAVTEAGWDPSTGSDIASTVQSTRYAYAYTAAGTETTAGWTFTTPIQTTIVMPGSSDIVHRVVLDPDTGQALQQRQPSAMNDSIQYVNGVAQATDPGTRLSRTWGVGDYNAANCTATVWYGLPCDARPASGNLPAATQTFYDLFLRPIKQTDTGTGGTTRTTLTAYGNSGISSRPASVQTTGGASGDTPIPDKTISYQTATGLPSGTTSGSGGSAITTSTSYDDFGRPLTATDGTGGQTAVTYESTTGRLATVTRTQGGTTVGTTTYAYNGGTERRGLSTGAAHSTLGTITAVYDADGQPISQTIPMVSGTLTQAWTRSSAGRATELDWTRSGATDPWITNTVTVDAHGRVATDTSTLYAVGGRVRGYSYDAAGRLTGVTDTREAACTTRTYGFDVNGNRTASVSYAPAADGSCQTSTATSTTSGSFAAADQPTGGTLAYDAFGRTTTLPAAQTAAASGSDVSLSYFVNDLVRSTTATPAGGSSLTSTWSLDASDRLACRRDKPTATTDASACGSTSTAGVVDTVNHYDGGSDSPAWTVTRTGGTTPTTTTAWYVPGLVGGLAATVTGSTATVALSDLHGDIPITTTTTQTAAPDGAISDTDEYGVVRDGSGAATTGPRYGWLGTAQRDATATAGLTLMGVRLYNPATGRFLSTDPVYGGNTTTYGYPTDPINQRDLDGRFCFFGWLGNTCTSYATDSFGRAIPVRWDIRQKLLIKHNINWSTAKYLIARLPQVSVTGTVHVFRGIVRELRCSWWSACQPTGRYVEVKMVVDFRVSDGRTFGLVTLHCVPTTRCPDWINSNLKL